MKRGESVLRQAERHEAANRQCAEIIVSDPVRYPPDGIQGIWARMFLANHQPQVQERAA